MKDIMDLVLIALLVVLGAILTFILWLGLNFGSS
jgi:hypothetical protein